MYVCLRVNKNIVVKGKIASYVKGDWVNVGSMMAREWIAAGDAFTVDDTKARGAVQPTSGIVVRGDLSTEWRDRLEAVGGLHLAFTAQDSMPELVFTETLIWDTRLELRLDLLMTGFHLLKKWQVAVALYDYTTLAARMGNAAQREATQAVIRDLRVPLRDTRLIFVRRCEDTRALMTAWGEALKTCPNEHLAFLQALYTVKPLVCDLPASWVGRGA